MNKGGRKPEYLPEYKGTDIATVRCMGGCGKTVERTVLELRKAYHLNRQTLCKECLHKKIDKAYIEQGKAYEARRKVRNKYWNEDHKL